MSDIIIIDIIQPPPQIVEVNIVDLTTKIEIAEKGEKGDPGSGVGNEVSEEFTGGTSSTLVLLHIPISGTVKLFKNGVRNPVAEYSYVGTTITLANPREIDDLFTVDYKY